MLFDSKARTGRCQQLIELAVRGGGGVNGKFRSSLANRGCFFDNACYWETLNRWDRHSCSLGVSVWAQNTCVVKGGTGTAWRIDTFDENGVTISGSSASSEPGKTVTELCVGIPSRQVRVTTTEQIAAAGGAVIPTRRTPASPYHVTITGLTVAQLNAVFGPPISNPARP